MRIGPVAYTPTLSGQANESGFEVKRAGTPRIAVSQYYVRRTEELESKKEYAVFFAICALYGVLFVLILLPIIRPSDIVQRLIFILFSTFIFVGWGAPFAAMVAYWASLPNLKRKNIREYHGCEHKVAALVGERTIEITLENLKKMPRLNIACGTCIACFQALLPLALINVLVGPNITMFVLAVFGLIAIPLLFQFFVTTKEPSEEKLKEGLSVAQNL